MANQQPSAVKVIAVSNGTDRNGRVFKRLTIQPLDSNVITLPDGSKVQAVSRQQSMRITAYEIPYYFDANDPNAEPDFFYHQQINAVLLGKIEYRPIVPTTLADGTLIERASVFVDGNSTLADWEDRVDAAFTRQGFQLLSSAKAPVVVPTTAAPKSTRSTTARKTTTRKPRAPRTTAK